MLPDAVVSSQEARRAISIRGARASTVAFAACLGVSLLALAALGWLVASGPPVTSLDASRQPDDRWTVTAVPPGGAAWNSGVRPGMEVIGLSPTGVAPSGDWSALLITDGAVQITIQRHGLPPRPEPLVAGVLAIALAILVYRFVPSIAWWLALAPPILASLNGALLVDPPLNLALEVAGPIAGTLYVAVMPPRQRARAAWVALGMVAVYVAAWGLSYAAALGDWPALRDLSVTLTLGLGMLGLATTIRLAVLRARARSSDSSLGQMAPVVELGLVVDELVPGRSRTRLTAIERERARLANDLHADVLPDLSAVIRSIEEGTSPDEAAQRLQHIAAELRELMGERRLSVLEELGLVPAFEWLVEQVEARTGVRVELEVEGALADDPEGRPPREVELTAYRVCQEALDNALLHARAHRIRVRVDVDAGHAEVEVSDGGVGIRAGDEERALRAGHLGLSDMRQRAAGIGASLRIRARPDGGTAVLLRWVA